MDEKLAKLLEKKSFKKGDIVVRQDEKSDGLYIIKSGHVEVLRDDKILATLEAGDFFGAMGVLLHEKRSATVRVISATLETYYLSNKAYEKTKATLERELIDKALERYKETYKKYI